VTGSHVLSVPTVLYRELRNRPVSTLLEMGSIYIGTCALILGVESSKAFTIIAGQGGGTIIARIMGAILLAGGLTATTGIIRRHTLAVLVGDVLISTGALIYTGGVLIGLHRAGLIASAFAGIACGGMALRVLLLSADVPARVRG
jgi:hypothetical protein